MKSAELLSDDNRIDDFGHIITAGRAKPGQDEYSDKIEVFRNGGADDVVDTDDPKFMYNSELGLEHGARAQVWQMWAIDTFTSDEVAYEAFMLFGLAGDEAEDKLNWVQLLEHISGTTANSLAIAMLMKKYGHDIDLHKVVQATLLDAEKPSAIQEGVRMRTELEKLKTASNIHDVEKRKEVLAGRAMAQGVTSSGLENSRDNPVIRDGKAWIYFHEQGVGDDVIIAAQNTGRADRYFSDLDHYDEKGVKKALEDREKLAELIRVDRNVIDAMTPDERRWASIDGKGTLAAIVGFGDAMSSQAKLQGLSVSAIESQAGFYTDADRNPYAKTDSESVFFFGEDWPGYYKQDRAYLISKIPKENQAAFAAELDKLNYQRVFNDVVLPQTVGANNPKAIEKLRYPLAA